MRKAGLILLTFLLAATTNAQFRVAMIGGINNSSVRETNNLPGWDSMSRNYSPRTGFHFGFMADLPFSNRSVFYFQPAVIFYNKGRKYTAPYDSTGVVLTYSSSQYVNYIDLPLNLILKLRLGKKNKFMLGGGPYLSFFYNGKESSDTLFSGGEYENIENDNLPVGKNPGQYKTFDYGVNALAGFEFGRVSLTANYSLGLGDFYTPTYTGHLNHQVIGATLGIYLGKPEMMESKLRDRDKDGIPDNKDACPTEPGTAATNGCPDKDGDGVADKDDKCPDVPGAANNHGCPVADRDHDGIPDDKDKCPDVAGSAKYNGCPIPDTDGDGINDEEDKCPTVKGVARYNGCPVPDTDGDGINNEEDRCPTVPGVKENHGCPPVKKEIVARVDFAAHHIQFEKRKTDLLPESLKMLDDVVKILKQNPGLRLSIEGHSSADGNYDVNMALSRERAENVKQYFISKGIDPKRLHAEGFGPNRPLNNGKTLAEQALNRRVELKVSN